MIDQLPMPIELQKFAIEGYTQHGRGFVHWISSVYGWETRQYHPEKDCDIFCVDPNADHLKRLVQVYDPVIEFVMFVGFKPSSKLSLVTNVSGYNHLYPRLVPLLKVG